jgi:Protein of unknown function (DUF3631)
MSTATVDSAPREELLPYLLDSVRQLVTRYVRLPGDEYADAIALWVVHAHAITAATTSPRLIFKSPEKASGKTRCLEVLDTIVPAPLFTVNASVAAVFRLLKDEQASLLFDETDAIFNPRAAVQHEDLRALLNAGWRKGATVARVVGDGKKMRVERFPVYAAVALAAIGDLPETIESRAIIIPMRRRAPDEALESFRLRRVVTVAEPLRESLSWWAERYHDQLAEREPRLPDGINDRLADSWEPLLAIAELADEGWIERARTAAARIAGGHVMDEASTGVQLLGDIRACFGSDDRITTASLLTKLNGLEEAAWGGFHDGKGLTARDLARRLKPYELGSRTIRLPDGSTPKGYLREDFADPWTRYLSPYVQAPQAPQTPRERICVADVAAVAPVRAGSANNEPDVMHEERLSIDVEYHHQQRSVPMMPYTLIRDGKVYQVSGKANEAGERVEKITEVPSFLVSCTRCGWRTVQLRSPKTASSERCSCGGELIELVVGESPRS